MGLPRGVTRIGWALTVVLMLGCVALAGPKEDASAVTSEWGQALGEDDPDKVLPFYADDAVLWGTLSPDGARGPSRSARLFRNGFQSSTRFEGHVW